MAIFERSEFINDTIELDGSEFNHCNIQHSTLVYRGGVLPRFSNCTIAYNVFRFDDAAIRTITFLSVMYRSGMKDVADHFIEMIKSGPPPTPTVTH